jgi:hypothetical protein
MERIDNGSMPRTIKEPFYVGLGGLIFVTYPALIREGRRYGDKMGIFEIKDPYSLIEIRDETTLDLANKLFCQWWEDNK